MATPFQPITKERAAEILSVSKRTVETWVADGTMPTPATIGRRVYWHPDPFFAWLNHRLGYVQQMENPSAGTTEATIRRRGRPRATLRVVCDINPPRIKNAYQLVLRANLSKGRDAKTPVFWDYPWQRVCM